MITQDACHTLAAPTFCGSYALRKTQVPNPAVKTTESAKTGGRGAVSLYGGAAWTQKGARMDTEGVRGRHLAVGIILPDGRAVRDYEKGVRLLSPLMPIMSGIWFVEKTQRVWGVTTPNQRNKK